MTSSIRKIYGHKFTAYCPQKDCSYTSKIPYVIAKKISNVKLGAQLNNTNSVHSQSCPKHRVKLVTKEDKDNLL